MAKLQEEANLSVSLVGSGEWETAKLDSLASASIAGGSSATVTANLYSLVEKLESSIYIDSVEVSTSLTSNTLPSDGKVTLAGGSKGSAVRGADWAKAYEAMLAYDVGMFVPCTTSGPLIGVAATAAIKAAGVKQRKERLCFAGGALAETIDEAVTQAKALNSKKVAYCYAPGGFYGANVLNPATPKKQYNSMFFAIKIAAMIAAQPDDFVATNKVIAAFSFGVKLVPADREKLLAGGVTAGVYNDEDLRIVERGITTSQSKLLAKEEIVSQQAMHTVAKDLRAALYRAIVGQPSTAPRKSTAENIFEERFGKWKDELKIASDFKNLIITEEGDTVSVQADLKIVTGSNFVLITLNVSV
ncbi:MAG: hypothetical protein AAF975_03985 [Spirochaetota bacterium]